METLRILDYSILLVVLFFIKLFKILFGDGQRVYSLSKYSSSMHHPFSKVPGVG